jgi:hypothetical protein
VESAAVFGSALHIAGMNRAALQQAIKSLDDVLVWQEVPPHLEDVFIHLLSQPAAGAP